MFWIVNNVCDAVNQKTNHVSHMTFTEAQKTCTKSTCTKSTLMNY